MKHINILLFSVLSTFYASAHDDEGKKFSSRPDSHAPIGVMGDHIHKTGEWMLSYRFMYMEMEGLLNGDNSLSNSEYDNVTPYVIRPDEMQTQMHMLGIMYAPTDNITLMASLPYQVKNMNLSMSDSGMAFETQSSGWGDAKLGSLIRLPFLSSVYHRMHINLAFTLPTGTTSKRDNTPMMKNALLPYGMQTGFDTWQVESGLTYSGHQQHGRFSWGAQILKKSSLEDNSHGYKAGDETTVNGWLSYLLTENISTSIRLNYFDRDGIEGEDSRLNPMMVSTAVVGNYAMQKASLFLGANFVLVNGALKGHRIALEIGKDIDEHHEGIGMNADTNFTLGWQKAF